MLDCLIVHVPKFQNRYRPLGNYTSTQWMALGVFALADAVAKRGHRVRILHLGLERSLDPRFSLESYLAAHPCRVVAFSAHFHQQLYDTLRVAGAVKERHPSVHIALGGMTASFFAGDILALFPHVDSVIRGEGEMPLQQLVAGVVAGGGDLSGVPNLLWRRNGAVVDNEGRYLASPGDLDALDFCNLSYMEHHESYVHMPKIFTHLRLPPRMKWGMSRLISRRERPIFHGLPVGRGCVTNCFYCGGGQQAHRLINERRHVVFRSPEKVMGSIRDLLGYGYEGAYVSFDPVPESDAYYRTLFGMLRAEGLGFDLPFSSWSLPSRGFIDEYAKTFGRGSYIAISPETGSEDLRKKVRGIFFSNEELLGTLRYAGERGVRTIVFFSLGLPGETRDDFERSLRLKERIEKECRFAETDAFSIEIEPAAPWYLNPERYQITLCRKGLGGFIREQRSPAYSSMTSLGYYKQEYLGERTRGEEDYARKVLRAKCRHFCGQRTICTVSAAFWWVTEALGLNPPADTRAGRLPETPLAAIGEIVSQGLCHRCGSCVGICPAGVLSHDDDDYPRWDNNEKCTGCGLCVRVCPGLAISFPRYSRMLNGRETFVGNDHGFFIKAFLGYSADPAVRNRSTSGGIGTQLPRYLVESGKAAGAFSVVLDEQRPWRPRGIIARTGEEILRGAYSKYPACSLNHLFRQLGDEAGPFVYTGLPCHVHGLRKMADAVPAIGEKVALTIGLLCHSCLDHQAIRDIFDAYGVDEREVERIEYRGGKLPGYIRALTKKGEWVYIPYPHLGPDRYRPNAKECLTFFFKFHSPERCRLCIDGTAEFADISIGDPWFKGWEAMGKLHGGYSYILARTEKGLKALEEAEKAGAIVLEPFSDEQAILSHGPMVYPKQLRAYYNIQRRRKKGLPAPDYDLMKKFSAAERVRAWINTATFFAADRPRLRRALFGFLLSRAGRPVVGLFFFRRRVLQAMFERMKRKGIHRSEM